jgi:tetratricopeptide (TPR) repeat protein
MKKGLLLFTLILCCAAFSGWAQESLYFSVSPAASVPLGESSANYGFAIGGGVAGHFPLDVIGLEATASLDYQGTFLQANAGFMNMIRLGGGIGFPFLKANIFSLWAQVKSGAFLALYGSASPLIDPWISGGLRLDLTLGKAFLLSLEPSYDMYLAMRSGALALFYSGIGIGVRAAIIPGNIGTGTREPKLKIMPPEFSRVFPVAYKYYDTHPIGTVKITNKESSRISGVKVEFFVPRYTEGAKVVAEIPDMQPGEEKEIPLTILFNKDVLNITEADKVQSQIMVRYTVSGTALSVQSNNTLEIFSRNNISWEDTRRAAAFVTANDPTVEKLAANVVAGINEVGGNAFTNELRRAIALFTALQQYGIRYVVDPSSSYQVSSQSKDVPDYLQFPVQTLDFKKGDCDDLSILYCAMLHSVGNKAAFITVPGHIYVAFDIGMTQEEMKRSFSSVNDFIVKDSVVWVPVEITMFDQGFVAAWAEGAREWRIAAERGNAELIPILEAWKEYAPTWFGSTVQRDVVDRFPSPASVSTKYAEVAKKLIDRESAPLIKNLKDQISKKSSPSLVNSLGAVYARYGMLKEAEASFKEAAASSYAPAIHNLGNLYYLKKDYANALVKYEQAYKLNPNNVTEIVALARTRYELQKYAGAQEMYALAKKLNPEQAEKIAYVAASSTDDSRAAGAEQRATVGWED